MARSVVQMTFTQANCETEVFAPFFCRIVHRMLVDPEEPSDQEDCMALLRKTDGYFVSGNIEVNDPGAVFVTIEHADMEGQGYGITRLPVEFSDVLRSKDDLLALVCAGTERLLLDPNEPPPDTPVVIVADDSRCGWVQAEKWADEYGAIILWWPMVADQFVGLAKDLAGAVDPESPADTGFDYWERGRKIGFKHGFSEGFYQARKEAENKTNRKKSTGK